MYQGTNPTAKRSQKWLADAFLELLQKTEYSKINIKDICEKADLSRQTFYQLFNDKEEVARYCILCRKDLALPPSELQSVTHDSIRAIILQFAQSIRRNADFVRLYRIQNLSNLLFEEIAQTISVLERQLDGQKDARLSLLANAFFSGALAKSLLVLVDNNEISNEEFTDFICSILSGSYYKFD